MAEEKTKKTKVSPVPVKKGIPAVVHSEVKLHRRSMVGIVLSDKMNKTRVVRVERQVKEGMYGKYITKSNKFKAHDEENRSKKGDLVNIVETRPLSKEKRWAVQKIIRTLAGDVLVKG